MMASGDVTETATTTTPTKSVTSSDISEAVNQLVQGKRHMLVQDYVSAVSSLEKACKLFAESYGETANECGEPYLYYGRALLELSRMETGVLGHALQGVESEEDDDDDDDDNNDEVSDDKDSKDSDDQVENPDNVTGDESDAHDDDEDGDESESIGEKSQDEAEAVPGNSEAAPSSTNDSKEKEDDVTNLQLAWEVLELAKVIFDRQSEKEEKMRLKSAEVLLKLGEVSIESENYTQAIEDLNSCLDIQRKLLTTDDRSIAETYYQLGLAFSLDNQFDNAVENFTNAIRVLEERIANCRLAIEQGGSVKNDDKEQPLEDPIDIAKRELEELEALLPDIKTKIEDTEDMKKSAAEAMKEAALSRLQETSAGELSGVISSPQASPSKPTKDVSHLVKRKRKPEDDVVNDSKEDIKKAKPEVDGSNEQITNGNALNGDQKMEIPLVQAS